MPSKTVTLLGALAGLDEWRMAKKPVFINEDCFLSNFDGCVVDETTFFGDVERLSFKDSRLRHIEFERSVTTCNFVRSEIRIVVLGKESKFVECDFTNASFANAAFVFTDLGFPKLSIFERCKGITPVKVGEYEFLWTSEGLFQMSFGKMMKVNPNKPIADMIESICRELAQV